MGEVIAAQGTTNFVVSACSTGLYFFRDRQVTLSRMATGKLRRKKGEARRAAQSHFQMYTSRYAQHCDPLPVQCTGLYYISLF